MKKRGRPKKQDKEKKVSKSIQLSLEQWNWIDKQRHTESISSFLRMMIAKHMEEQDQ